MFSLSIKALYTAAFFLIGLDKVNISIRSLYFNYPIFYILRSLNTLIINSLSNLYYNLANIPYLNKVEVYLYLNYIEIVSAAY